MSSLEWINLVCAIVISAPLASIVAQAIRRAAWSSGLTFCIVSLVCLAAGGAQTWVAGDLLGLIQGWGNLTVEKALAYWALIYASGQVIYKTIGGTKPMISLREWPARDPVKVELND
jgi:hypothetical protein